MNWRRKLTGLMDWHGLLGAWQGAGHLVWPVWHDAIAHAYWIRHLGLAWRQYIGALLGLPLHARPSMLVLRHGTLPL
ncbi:hypothetical protein HAX54_025903 [Datura stramonium]|uniref:Uncharacterized protein n=1 Tax=Datura stramonium TaxID=4076 RepID=A0ABS8V109_DATST|nr:hypothetical protein [Datura stramonium]